MMNHSVRGAFLLLASALSLPVHAQSDQAATQAESADSIARWVTLGTSGGPTVIAERSQIANALVVGGEVYLFDVGSGTRRQLARAHLPEAKIKAVFLSHHHWDHTADVVPLVVSRSRDAARKLKVIGPQGTNTLVEGAVIAGGPMALAGFVVAGPERPPLEDSVEAVEIAPDLTKPTIVFQDDKVRVEAISVAHYQIPPAGPLTRMPQAVAFRVTAGGRTFVYTGDAGPSPTLAVLAKDADVLISEVVEADAITRAVGARSGADGPQRQGTLRTILANHLPPAYIGQLAVEAGVKQIVLTHFVPAPESAPDPDAFVRDIVKVYKGPVSVANDLTSY